MVFTSLSNKSTIGNTFTMGLDPKVSRTLQEVAWLTHNEFRKRVINSGLK